MAADPFSGRWSRRQDGYFAEDIASPALSEVSPSDCRQVLELAEFQRQERGIGSRHFCAIDPKPASIRGGT